MSDEKKKSFVIYQDWMNMVLDLPDEQALDLARTIFAYCVEREYQSGAVASAVFATFKDRIDEDIQAYKARCEQNAENVRKRWENKRIQSNTTVCERNTTVCERKHDNDYDTDNGNDYEYGNGSDNDNALRDKKRVEAKASKREILDALVAKWNSYADRGSIPTVRSVSVDSKTGRSVLARVSEHGLDEAVEMMDTVFRSNYLRGFKNGWCAKFDWVFLPTNYEKIMNGNYNDADIVKTQNNMIDQWVAEESASGW